MKFFGGLLAVGLLVTVAKANPAWSRPILRPAIPRPAIPSSAVELEQFTARELAVFYDDSINQFIRATLENFRGQMSSGMPDLGVPVLEPLSIPRINEHIVEGPAAITVVVDQLKVSDLSTFTINSMDVNLQDLRLQFNLHLPQVTANGVYALDGKVFNFVPLYGKGNCKVKVAELDIGASAALTITPTGSLQVTNDFDLSFGFGGIFVNFENLMGGGNLGNVVNGVVNALGKPLFDKFQPVIKKELKKALLGEINKALSGVNINDIGKLIPGK